MRVRKRWIPLAVVTVLSLPIVFGQVQVNLTESVPLGLYRPSDADEPLAAGTMIRFCLTEDHARILAGRPFLRSGTCPKQTQEIAKPIVGVPGDRIRHTAEGVSINGTALPASPTYPTDSYALPMPHVEFGERVLGEGEYWVHSPYVDRALDSRVNGPVRRNQIRGRWTPLLTWTTHSQEANLRKRGRSGSVLLEPSSAPIGLHRASQASPASSGRGRWRILPGGRWTFTLFHERGACHSCGGISGGRGGPRYGLDSQ